MHCSPGGPCRPDDAAETADGARFRKLLPESGDDLARAVDAEQGSRPQDWQIEPGLAILREPVAAAPDGADQADRVEHPVAQRIAVSALLGAIGLRREAARPQQAL